MKNQEILNQIIELQQILENSIYEAINNPDAEERRYQLLCAEDECNDLKELLNVIEL